MNFNRMTSQLLTKVNSFFTSSPQSQSVFLALFRVSIAVVALQGCITLNLRILAAYTVSMGF